MRPQIPTLLSAGGVLEWARRVAQMVNILLTGYPFPSLDADPPTSGLKPSFTYYNTVSNTTRQWTGAVWQVL